MNRFKFITFNYILMIAVVLLATVMLSGRSIGYKWSGCEGIQENQIVTNVQTGQTLERGEVMEATDQYRAFAIGETRIFLSKNTQVKLVDLHEGQIDLQLIQGRIVANGAVNVSVRDVDVNILQGAQASIVHYSWLDELEIAPMKESTEVKYDNESMTLESAIKIKTLPEYEYLNIEFDTEKSSEANFYSWVTK